MTGHTSRHRVNTILHLDPAGFHGISQFAHCVLGLGHCHTVTGNNHYSLSQLQQHGYLFRLGAGDLAGIDLVRIDGFTTGGHLAKQYIGQGAIHGNTHNFGQDQSRGSHQGAGDNQYRVAENKAGKGRRYTGIGVEQGNYYRHICTTNRHHQEQPQQQGQGNNGHQCRSIAGVNQQ